MVSERRLLFVDDEPAIRLTLPVILTQEGFEVTTAATVSEGLELIQSQQFDILLTDLNIGHAGDGFMLVSAMRRLQPDATTFILTGYPDFETALEAIRKQVDDYFIKPADIRTLVSTMKERLLHPRHLRDEPTKRVSALLRENARLIAELWLAEVMADQAIRAMHLSDGRRIDQLPHLAEALAKGIEEPRDILSEDSRVEATKHGETRAHQGFSAPLLIKESRLLAKTISEVIQANLLALDLSTLVPDVLRIGIYLNALLEESLVAFERTRAARAA